MAAVGLLLWTVAVGQTNQILTAAVMVGEIGSEGWAMPLARTFRATRV